MPIFGSKSGNKSRKGREVMFIKMNNKKGFTLVEIMIVVAIIGLLAAIAIPNLLRARLNANESAAKGGLRTLSTAMESYRAAQATPTYPTALTSLSGATPPYIDSVLGAGSKQGYTFSVPDVGSNGNTYAITAIPITANVTGSNSFCVDHTGVLYTGSGTASNACTGTPVS